MITTRLLRVRPANVVRTETSHLDDHGEVLSAHVVVSFDEDLAQSTLADRIVLGVELVEAVKRVPVLYRYVQVMYSRCTRYVSKELEVNQRVQARQRGTLFHKIGL